MFGFVGLAEGKQAAISHPPPPPNQPPQLGSSHLMQKRVGCLVVVGLCVVFGGGCWMIMLGLVGGPEEIKRRPATNPPTRPPTNQHQKRNATLDIIWLSGVVVVVVVGWWWLVGGLWLVGGWLMVVFGFGGVAKGKRATITHTTREPAFYAKGVGCFVVLGFVVGGGWLLLSACIYVMVWVGRWLEPW